MSAELTCVPDSLLLFQQWAQLATAFPGSLRRLGVLLGALLARDSRLQVCMLS